MSTKQELLNAAAREYKAFHESIQGLNEEHMTEVWLGTWSVRDIVAHIMIREQHLADRLHEIQMNESLPPCYSQDELDTFFEEFGYPDFGSPLLDEQTANSWIFEKYRNVALEELVAQELAAFTSIVSALENLPEEAIKHHNVYDRVAENTYHHYRTHIRDIKAWLRVSAINPKKP